MEQHCSHGARPTPSSSPNCSGSRGSGPDSAFPSSPPCCWPVDTLQEGGLSRYAAGVIVK